MANYKIFNDPIHGAIKLKQKYVDIIDTPQFQRLRHIHQLGSNHFVYPSATHTRFEHSIGVCHLAEKLTKKLQLQLREENQSVQILDAEVECVAVAGLCHDLGHGPFSHLWQDFFHTSDKSDMAEWKHEKESVKVFQEINEKLKIFGENEENFICDLIEPNAKFRENLPNKKLADKFNEKSFLWEIVNNETNKVDVDKWDYFERDCHYLGKRNSFDFVRLMEFIRVVKNPKDQRLVLAYRDKEAHNISHMFHMRWFFHHRYYQHNKAKLIGKMLVDAFELFDVGDRFNLRRSNDYDIITKLRKVIESETEEEKDDEFKKKAELLNRIEKRDFYTIICHHAVKPEELDKIKSKISEELTPYDAFFKTLIDDKLVEASEKENFYFDLVKFDYGNKDKDPLIKVRFYSKENKDEVCNNEDALRFTVMRPQCLFEYLIYFVSKNNIEKERKGDLQNEFKQWIDKMIKQD